MPIGIPNLRIVRDNRPEQDDENDQNNLPPALQTPVPDDFELTQRRIDDPREKTKKTSKKRRRRNSNDLGSLSLGRPLPPIRPQIPKRQPAEFPKLGTLGKKKHIELEDPFLRPRHDPDSWFNLSYFNNPTLKELKEQKDPKGWRAITTEAYRNKMIFLSEALAEESARTNELLGLMLYFDDEFPGEDQYLFINCPGGSLMQGLAVVDMIANIVGDVHTVCMGMAVSTACMILAAGTPEKRSAFPSSWTLIRKPTMAIDDDATYEDPSIVHIEEVYDDMLVMQNLSQNMKRVYAEATGKPISVIEADLEREEEIFMTATQTKEYGLVDHVSASAFGNPFSGTIDDYIEDPIEDPIDDSIDDATDDVFD